MYKSRLFLGLLLLVCLLAPQSIQAAGGRSAMIAADEQFGIEASVAGQAAQPTSRPDRDVLIIPESTADVVGMYDPFDGAYLGDLTWENPGFSTPINAIEGPDGNIYVSEQLNDKVFVFDGEGNYLYIYADETDGLNNLRGIAFRDGELFVTSGDDYVARFDGPHSRLPDFINDGSEPFDIYFLEDGSALVADIIGTTDNVRYYDALGNFQYELFAVDFPEQIQGDPVLPGAFLNTSFSADLITDFDLDGTIHDTWFFNGGRGIYRLGNGNLLATAGDGVWEIDPETGGLLELEHAGSGRFIELLLGGPSSVVPGAGRPCLALVGAPTIGRGDLSLRFELPSAARVQIGMFDASGRCLAQLHQGNYAAGSHELRARELAGAVLPSGIYFIRLRADDAWAARRVVVSR